MSPQEDHDHFKLTITGEASISCLADRAFVKLAVTHTDSNKQDVSEKVLTTARSIERLIDETQTKFKKSTTQPSQAGQADTSAPVAHWSKTSLTSTSRMEWMPSNVQERTFTSRIDFDIRFRDFAALGDFTATISGVDYCEVEDVSWVLLPATKKSFESRLRKEASADALAKCKDYCASFCPDVDVVTVKPHSFVQGSAQFTDLFGRPPDGRRMLTQQQPQQMQARAMHSASENDHLVFTPQECKMELTISLLFLVETKGFAMSLRDDEMAV